MAWGSGTYVITESIYTIPGTLSPSTEPVSSTTVASSDSFGTGSVPTGSGGDACCGCGPSPGTKMVDAPTTQVEAQPAGAGAIETFGDMFFGSGGNGGAAVVTPTVDSAAPTTTGAPATSSLWAWLQSDAFAGIPWWVVLLFAVILLRQKGGK